MINGEILLLPKQEPGYYNIKNMNKKILGLSIVEALVATVIVGIGFVAVLQMTSFAVTSIDTSGERTKANYIVSMIAEDIIGHRDSDTQSGNRLADELITEGGFNADISNCRPRAILAGNTDINTDTSGTEVSTIYGKVGTLADTDKAKIVKDRKWRSVFQDNNFVKCKSDQDVKTVRIFKICAWSDCLYQNSNITDEGLYLGRVQININDGKKRKYLYFQADYKLKLFDFNISEIDEIKFFDGYAFYAYPNEAQLNFSNYDYILKNKKEFLQFQCFGGKYGNNLRDIFFRELDPKISKKEKEKLWINNCLDFSISFFQKNLFFVGCTRQLDRLRYLIDCLKNYTVKKKFDIKFSNKLSFVTKSDDTIKSHKKNLKFQRSLLFLFRMYLIRRIKKLFSVLLLK